MSARNGRKPTEKPRPTWRVRRSRRWTEAEHQLMAELIWAADDLMELSRRFHCTTVDLASSRPGRSQVLAGGPHPVADGMLAALRGAEAH